MADPRFERRMLIGPGGLKYNEIGRTAPGKLDGEAYARLLDAGPQELSRVLHGANGTQNYGMVCLVSELALRGYSDALSSPQAYAPEAATHFASVVTQAAMSLPSEPQAAEVG